MVANSGKLQFISAVNSKLTGHETKYEHWIASLIRRVAVLPFELVSRYSSVWFQLGIGTETKITGMILLPSQFIELKVGITLDYFLSFIL